jgi:RNAse (barnase) inhibitor barstar
MIQDTSAQTGIFRLDRKDLPALQAAARELGQAFYLVDLSHARNVPGFIKAMRRDLQFPEWFGGNLDALNDCLTDFSWRPASGYVIALSGSEMLRATPTSLATLNEVLSCAVEEWERRDVPFRIFYLQDRSAH